MSFYKCVCLFLFVVPCMRIHAQDRVELPQVPGGFTVSVYASDPLVRNPCVMAFDVRGRLYVGQGPQYRKPKPDSPTDRITMLIDSDGDGVADKAKTFASGFNSIQGLAWYGDQLWIANAPDLTVVRDTDGDDVADEYRRVFGGLLGVTFGILAKKAQEGAQTAPGEPKRSPRAAQEVPRGGQRSPREPKRIPRESQTA